MQKAGQIADNQEQGLYLVGGAVRDLLLGQSTLDLDMVIEGNAIDLAQQLADFTEGKIKIHPRFNTANLKWDKWSIDLTTARTETYVKPGALPEITPSTITNDLSRRDFTINAMAVSLNINHYGTLNDQHGGTDDLEHKLIRVLHEKSFTDDATRIWRALRYEQRLDFHLEPDTLRLLKRDIHMLDTINGDRIRYEVECILGEKYPEKILHRAEELGVLPKLSPALKGNKWLGEKFQQTREISSPDTTPKNLYIALLVYPLTSTETERLISFLRVNKVLAQTLRDTINVKNKLISLTDPELKPAVIYHLLHGYSRHAVIVNAIASNLPIVKQNIQLFLDKLRYVKPTLTGNDLQKMGITQGLQIKKTLQKLLEARLNEKVNSKQEEIKLVEKQILANK
ncbi:MAG: CCA tRNA nucleotidyltransferase [Dehalococcoidales bacterium]|nr:CCA tRNA nucleotidyltransferase [Dehalococcoidales bacterium]